MAPLGLSQTFLFDFSFLFFFLFMLIFLSSKLKIWGVCGPGSHHCGVLDKAYHAGILHGHHFLSQLFLSLPVHLPTDSLGKLQKMAHTHGLLPSV